LYSENLLNIRGICGCTPLTLLLKRFLVKDCKIKQDIIKKYVTTENKMMTDGRGNYPYQIYKNNKINLITNILNILEINLSKLYDENMIGLKQIK
jgi:hypothetical protein